MSLGVSIQYVAKLNLRFFQSNWRKNEESIAAYKSDPFHGLLIWYRRMRPAVSAAPGPKTDTSV